MKETLKKLLLKIVSFVLAAVMLALAAMLSETAFDEVLDFRMLERIPVSHIREAVGGESQLKGQAVAREGLVEAPKTKSQSIYFRYLLEREEKDSDGNTSWRTVRDESSVRDFYLEDRTGRALIRIREDLWQTQMSVKQKYRRTEGKYRHTEWRIDPGDTLTVYGWLEAGGEPRLDFSTEGHYVPIISGFGAGEERSRIALRGIMMLWGGVTLLLFGCFAIVFGLQIHRTLVFLTIVSMLSGLLLFHYGYRSVESDVTNGYERVQEHWRRANTLINERLESRNLLPMGLQTPIDLSSLAYAELSDLDKLQIDA